MSYKSELLKQKQKDKKKTHHKSNEQRTTTTTTYRNPFACRPFTPKTPIRVIEKNNKKGR